MNSKSLISSAALPRSTYSESELASLYALSRFYLENGEIRKAETILLGLNQIAPDFLPAWIALSYIMLVAKEYQQAASAARQAMIINPDSAEAILFSVVALMTLKDYNSAGTYLGELGEKIQAGQIDNPNIVRVYKSQLARYHLLRL